MKKYIFISALLISLMCTFNIKTKADITNHIPQGYNVVLSYPNSPFVTTYCVSDSSMNNEIVFQKRDSTTTDTTWYNFVKPVGVLKPNGTNAYLLQIFAYGTNAIYSFDYYVNNDSVTSSSYDSAGGIVTSFSSPYNNIVFGNIPVFTTMLNASGYSTGGNYDVTDIVGGSIPYQTPSIGTEEYENHIYSFEKVWNVYRHSLTPMSWMISWSQPYDSTVDLYEDTSYHRQVGITIKYPTKQSLHDYMYSIWTEPQSIATTMEYAYNLFTVEGMYDSRLTYAETTIWVDIDDLIQNPTTYGDWFTLNHTTDTQQYVFIMNETVENWWTVINNNYTFNPKGILQIFREYYEDNQLFCLSLPYMQFVKAQMFTFNSTTNTVYNPIYIYWMDATAPDGTVQERRNFGSPTNVESSDLVEPRPDNNNIGVSHGVPNLSENDLQNNYTQSITDSYNNIYNNYYYNYSSNQDILDYLNRFKDGGTQEEIQDAFGYVNSTVDSVSNVPLLLGKLFNGFFPPFVIKLFSALFIIFGVFIVIKIIRHLFL